MSQWSFNYKMIFRENPKSLNKSRNIMITKDYQLFQEITNTSHWTNHLIEVLKEDNNLIFKILITYQQLISYFKIKC